MLKIQKRKQTLKAIVS